MTAWADPNGNNPRCQVNEADPMRCEWCGMSTADPYEQDDRYAWLRCDWCGCVYYVDSMQCDEIDDELEYVAIAMDGDPRKVKA